MQARAEAKASARSGDKAQEQEAEATAAAAEEVAKAAESSAEAEAAAAASDGEAPTTLRKSRDAAAERASGEEVRCLSKVHEGVKVVGQQASYHDVGCAIESLNAAAEWRERQASARLKLDGPQRICAHAFALGLRSPRPFMPVLGPSHASLPQPLCRQFMCVCDACACAEARHALS